MSIDSLVEFLGVFSLIAFPPVTYLIVLLVARAGRR